MMTLFNKIFKKILFYLILIRIHKPIGIFLLISPTLSGLWLASNGHPEIDLIIIFILGTIFMRSAGCAINDFVDQNIDKHIKRTEKRPLTSGLINSFEVISVTLLFLFLSFLLILYLNNFTKILSIIAVFTTITYPYLKRFFFMPQAYLGLAFSFGILMSFTAVLNEITTTAWLLLLANIFWTIAYDTEYAIVDKVDDLKIGIKTSAIFFGKHDILVIKFCYVLFIGILIFIGYIENLNNYYFIGIIISSILILYNFFLIRNRDPKKCFTAFNQNGTIGIAVLFSFIFGFLD